MSKYSNDVPGFFKAWFAFVAVIAVGLIGLAVWAVITVVNWLVAR